MVGFGGQWGYYTDNETAPVNTTTPTIRAPLVLCGLRYYDPNTGRFITRDPTGYEGGINPYTFCGNNPVNYADPLGTDFDYNSHQAVADLFKFVGEQLARSGKIRDQYREAIKNLDPLDKAGRQALKIKFRSMTPPLVSGVIAKMRPGTGPNPGSVASANKSNKSVDTLGKRFKYGGRILFALGIAYDIHDIITSENHTKKAFEVIFGTLGSVAGGTLGATVGTAIAPGAGTVIGGVGGSIAGGYMGRKTGNWLYDKLFQK